MWLILKRLFQQVTNWNRFMAICSKLIMTNPKRWFSHWDMKVKIQWPGEVWQLCYAGVLLIFKKKRMQREVGKVLELSRLYIISLKKRIAVIRILVKQCCVQKLPQILRSQMKLILSIMAFPLPSFIMWIKMEVNLHLRKLGQIIHYSV